MEKSIPKPRISIVGAGVAGISAAVALRNQLGYENFVIYEKSSQFGGTWTTRTRGAVLIPRVTGILFPELNPDWTSFYALQPEIRAYWEGVCRKHNLDSHFVPDTKVIYARWDNGLQAYELTLENVKTGIVSHAVTEILVSAIGGFMTPDIPKDIGDTSVFKGDLWHSARWRHDVSLSGKRVAVVGNGCSGAQFIPEIAKDPSTHILNLCRTPQWFIPKSQYNYPGIVKWAFRYLPFVLRWYRNYIMATTDLNYIGFSKNNKLVLHVVRKSLERYMRASAPKEYHDSLIPAYSPGCKRVIVDGGYLRSLHQPNVDLCWEAIDSIVENGIRLRSGRVIEVDVIILSTGFGLLATELKMQGSDGRTLEGYYAAKNSPVAYLGTCVPGFPNLFMLFGPNTITGHASVIFGEEVQIQYALQLMKPVVDGLAKSFEVRDEATDAYNVKLQKTLEYSVTQDCRSYYRNGSGVNYVSFPGSMAWFYWLLRKVRWENFKSVGAEKWEEARTRKRRIRMAVAALAAALAAGIYFGVDRYLDM